MVVKFHIRKGVGKWFSIPGTEQPNQGDITLDFDLPSSTPVEQVQFLLGYLKSVEMNGGRSPIYSNKRTGWLLMCLGLCVFIPFIYTAYYFYFYHEQHPFRSLLLNAAWIVGVPIYFFVEHEFFFYYCGNPLQYDQFKRVQDLAAKIWVGALAVLAAILALKLHT